MPEKGKILVVDDLKANVELLGAILAEAGFAVIKAYSGNEAIDAVKKERPDLILLDIMMPELDGFQVCGMLRSDSDTASIPIIMVTSKDKDNDIVQSLVTGADDYIIKPVVKNELLRKVDNLISKAKTGELPSQLYSKKLKSEQEKGD